MWSNFNDSFTALTGHISTQLRQSIPTIQTFGDQQQQQQADCQRQLQTKIGLLRNEVVRHRNIAMMYKERWLQAERVCKDAIGQCSQVYDDDVNLLEDDDDEFEEDTNKDSQGFDLNVKLSSNDNIDNNDDSLSHQQLSSSDDNSIPTKTTTELIEKQEEPKDDGDDNRIIFKPASSSSTINIMTNVKQPKCIKDLILDPAIQQIHKLQDEIKKLQTDGEHWRKLAKQKSAIEEAQLVDLNQARSQLKNCIDECQRYRKRCQELEIHIEQWQQESQQELQQLDQLHEQERNKLLMLRDELIEENSRLKLEIDVCNKKQFKDDQRKKDNVEQPSVSIQTDGDDHLVEQIDFAGQTDNDDHNKKLSDENLSVQKIIEQSLQRLEDGMLPKLNDGDLPKFERLEKIFEFLCKRIDDLLLQQKTTSMTLLDEQQLNHGDQVNVQHLMDELDKISKEKSQLEQKLDELQLRFESLQQEREASQQQESTAATGEDQQSSICNDANASTTKTSASIFDLLTLREEPEGANNDTQVQQDYSVRQQAKQDCIIESLQSKLSLLTCEHEELWQKFNSTNNENQIYERRFKEIEEESFKHCQRIREMEQERDLLQSQLTELETKHGMLQQNLDSTKAKIICQAELEHWRNQCDNMKQQLNQLSEDNSILKSSLASKDIELIKLREMHGELELSLSKIKQQQTENDNVQVEKLTIELNRLRQHLVQVEETYFGYLKEAEERYEQMQQVLQQYEQMNLKQRQAEHEELVQSLRKELDQCREEIHQFEDKNERLAANLVNLQSVIEQLEKEHERKIQSLNEEHQKQLVASDQRTEEWCKRFHICEEHLHETRQALEAASRLSEKIDQKELIIEQLKREAKKKDDELLNLKKKIDDLQESSEGKVDKQIVKSLVLSYLATPTDKRSDGERLLARFLDFNQEEMNRVGIRIGRHKSLNDSFTSKFVHFLETESVPETAAPTNQSGGNGHERKLSSSSLASLTTSPQQMELARDLNKRLNLYDQQQTGSGLVNSYHHLLINPFVGQSSIASTTTITHHSRSLSSSTEYTHPQNQLLANADPSLMNVQSTIVLPSAAVTTTNESQINKSSIPKTV